MTTPKSTVQARNIFLSLTICLVLPMLSACGGNKEAYAYFPLEVGSENVYEGRILPEMPGFGTFMIVDRSVEDVTINGRTYVRNETEYQGLLGADGDVSYSRIGGDGVYTIDNDHPDQVEYLAYPFDIKQGDSWEVNAISQQLMYRFTEKTTAMLNGAELKDCRKFELSGMMEGDPVEGYEIYCRNIGLVRTILTLPDASLRMEIQLLE